MHMVMNQLEEDILAWMSSKSSSEAFATQAQVLKVTNREYTGVGCYTDFEIPTERNVQPIRGHSQPYPGPHIEAAELEAGAGTHLWIQDGFITCLEIFAYGNSFPEDLTEYKLKG